MLSGLFSKLHSIRYSGGRKMLNPWIRLKHSHNSHSVFKSFHDVKKLDVHIRPFRKLDLDLVEEVETILFAIRSAQASWESSLGHSRSLVYQCERCSTMDEDELTLLSNYEVCRDCMKPLHQRSPSPLPSSHLGNSGNSLVPGAGFSKQECFSTKLNAVVKNVAETSGSESKTIVFSFWKSTLRVLARLLSRASINYIEVNVDTSYAARSTNLTSFKENPDVHVLLMTIQTGAVGLNLAVASRVHIIEPQWNPSIEAQATSRALRMGQKSEVIVFRYVTQNTVEQNVVDLQKRKSALAGFTLAPGGAEHNISNTLQEVEDVLQLRPQKRPASEM